MGGFPDETQRMFKFVDLTKRPYDFDNRVHISITHEVDLDLKVVDR